MVLYVILFVRYAHYFSFVYVLCTSVICDMWHGWAHSLMMRGGLYADDDEEEGEEEEVEEEEYDEEGGLDSDAYSQDNS